jgi:uncharacterized protein VirK/YbjX
MALRAFCSLVTSRQRISDVLSIIRSSNSATLIARKPGTILKWSGKYLAKDLTPSQRSQLLAFHHHFVGERINDVFYDHLLSEGFVMWRLKTDAGEVKIQLRHADSLREGDLSLVMTINRARIYELAFTIVPGEFVNAPAPVFFVSRVQGRSKHFEAIRQATKMCCDVSPPYALVAAAEGVAAALGVGWMASVSNANQVCARRVFDYGSFWETLSFEKAGHNCYASALPISPRPLDQCSPQHRRRTKKKRNYKADLAKTVQNAFERECSARTAKIDCTPSENISHPADMVAAIG